MARRVCVFCGSSSGARESYATAATSLARYVAGNGIAIVYGGGKVGLMGKLADEALGAGGEVIGVMPRSLVEKELAHTRLSDLRVVESMHERKAHMAELSDAFIALPGGYGTFEEFCEVLTWTQLGLQRKPCGILNVDGYYDQLLSLFDHAVDEQFLQPVHRQMLLSDSRPESLVSRLLEYEPPLVEKWIDLRQS
ncbi:MAG: TIGR00730 family Rossman fold protein [Acidobacteriaceae bacterium]|nr:TIGR00730 family Rossman fold protein [Acidobacteriaceae bacterium]MBV9497926.1 TIGR00730 family Rossman fold protein [Acidobacteriaceae bacterium]